MTDDVLFSQAEYYRRRASEYDATSYGDVDAARTRVARIVAQVEPRGSVLEIACGTGIWTEALARTARAVTAIDMAPEVLAIARERVPASNVRFDAADIFSWSTPQRFDVIFFSAWLSHVPYARFGEFWRLLRALLADGGRVLFVDEPVELREKETYVAGDPEVVERRLLDGTAFRLVKNFIDPDLLEQRLRELGWRCRTWRDAAEWVWLCGEAFPVG